METFRRILVPTDGSDHSEFAVRKALSLARVLRRPVLALFIIDRAALQPLPAALKPFPDEGLLVDLRAILRAEAHRVLDRVLSQGRRRRVRVQTRVVVGHPEEAIVRAARPTDLLVIATHGRGGLTRLLLGSVTDHVVRHASCPVLVVRRGRR